MSLHNHNGLTVHQQWAKNREREEEIEEDEEDETIDRTESDN